MTTFSLPHGGSVEMTVRDGTNDFNVCYSILTEDEYRIDSIKPLSGVALDVGAHIGAATVLLAELNPDLRVVAIEPIPENYALLVQNTARYGDRVTCMQAAAGKNGRIAWNWSGDKSAIHHRYIGNQHFDSGTPHDVVTVPTVSLSALVTEYGPIAFLKIDCEGCEHSFLDDPAVEQVERIHGEYHDGPNVRCSFDKPKRDPGERPANRRKRGVA